MAAEFENNYAIVIAKLSDWLKIFMQVFQPMRSKTKIIGTLYARFFPRFEQVTDILQGIVIGSSRCLFLL